MFKQNSWFNLILIAALAALPLIAAADETRYQYDENAPEGMFSLENFRASLRGLAQMDVVPLRPQAKRVIDGMEYTTSAAAQAQYSGTGVTISAETSIKQEGSASLKAVIDGTADRSFGRTMAINLAAFQKVTIWTRASATSSAIQFYVSDGTNSSYWNITTDSSANTWKQHTLTLASPDANSGSPASLAAVTSYGFRLLDASTTYYFDTVKAIVGMSVAVRGTNIGDYYRNVYLGISPVQINAQAAPTITAPTGNPRIDILTIDSAGALAWVAGTEASSPTVPWASMPTNKIPVALVYCKTTMTQVLDYEDKDTDANQGYIYADVRPFLNLGGGSFLKGADVTSGSTVTLGNDGNVFDITGTTQINTITAKPAGTVVWLQFDGALTVKNGTGNINLNGDFVTAAGSVLSLFSEGATWREISRQPIASNFLALTDTPDSYSGQAKKYVRVNSGATATEFIADPFDVTSGHDHDGSDAKKVLATNLDPTGITDGEYLKRSGAGVAGGFPAFWYAVASDTVGIGNDAEKGAIGPTNYLKMKSITCYFYGTVRVSYEYRQHDAFGPVYSRFYKNGVAYGSVHGPETSQTYVPVSEGDVTVAWGDTLEVWGHSSHSDRLVDVRNFRLSFTVTPTTQPTTLTRNNFWNQDLQ